MPHPADVLLGVAVGVAVAGALGAERPVGHRHPHVVQRRQLPPGEAGPVPRVDGLDEDGRQRDGRQGLGADGGPQPPGQLDQPGAALGVVRHVLRPLDVVADPVEALAAEPEVPHGQEPAHVGVEVIELREVPGHDLDAPGVGPLEHRPEDLGVDQVARRAESSLAAWRYSVFTPALARSSIDSGVTEGGAPLGWYCGAEVVGVDPRAEPPVDRDVAGRRGVTGGSSAGASGSGARVAGGAVVVGAAAARVARVVVGRGAVVVGARRRGRRRGGGGRRARRRRWSTTGHRQVGRRHLQRVGGRGEARRGRAGPGGGADEGGRQQRLADETGRAGRARIAG